jgi:small subunit ribosomal protein S4
MARNTGPQCRLCRAEKTKLFLKGERCNSSKCPITQKKGAPGKGPRSRMRKVSDYGLQLREKQKVKRMYIMLERRLDNIVYRMRFASSRKQGRQLVSHGHVQVNGSRVNIASYLVKAEDEITICESSQKLTAIKDSLKEYSRSGAVPWLNVDPDKMMGKVLAIPRRNDLVDLAEVKEQMIVELYSK